ncbi:MAG TPA: ACT domain-containing protein [Candidatus Avimonoglobus intestinipullorum]|uniref:ACT domain-containing protein n=1 Tax=Candidatus Avimonoglobus intestinipullorum TaxID=2840699 RepID=A0A9D1LUK3_9FIRM|nr:ACT domain-containing protein [Candidatus Avimonoglobus intestinipullorum]
MLVKQISVFVENKSGRLAEIIGILGANGIDISALSIADTTDFGILRLIVNDPPLAEKVLKDNGMVVKATDVIAIAVEDKPGGLAKALKLISDARIEIEYMYAFIGKSDNGALVIVRVNKPDEAVDILENSGISIIDAKDVYRL